MAAWRATLPAARRSARASSPACLGRYSANVVPAPDLARRRDEPAVLLDDAVHRREAEPGAAGPTPFVVKNGSNRWDIDLGAHARRRCR